MSTQKIGAETNSLILTFLNINWSFRSIQKHLNKHNITVSLGHISNLKNGRKNSPKLPKSKKQVGRKSSMDKRKINRLKNLISNPNPKTQISMAKILKVSRFTIRRNIKKLGFRLLKKPKCHHLSLDSIEKRRKRAWPLYCQLRQDRWQKYITTDEAWIYLDNSNGKTKVQYLSRDKKRSECEAALHKSWPKGVMVWAGISANGPTRALFVEPGAKINSDYYIKKILKPFIKYDFYRLYPNGDGVFHQDSAPSHSSKKTVDFLNRSKINFIKPYEWMPNSPDAAPCDFFLWGYLKHRLNSLNIKTIKGLKKCIQRELKNIPQNYINSALKAWPKRCRRIYYTKGCQIEKNN